MLRLLFLLFIAAICWQFSDFFRGPYQKDNEITGLLDAAAQLKEDLQPGDSVCYFANDASNEIRYKVQFAMSPVRLVKAQGDQTFTGMYILFVHDRRAEQQSLGPELSQLTAIKEVTTRDSIYTMTLYRL